MRSLVLHDDSFISLLKAAMLKEIRGWIPVHEKASSLLASSNPLSNNYSLKELMLEWEWSYEKPNEVTLLRNAVELAVLHKDKDYDLIIDVLIQALHKGYEHVLSQNTVESKRFFSLVREVRNELYRARLFTKFISKGNYLIGLFKFEHETIELILRFFNKKLNKNLIIADKGTYYTLSNEQLIEFQPLLAN